MKKKKNGYGVLASNSSKQEKLLDFTQEIESRLVIPTLHDGQVLTLVTRLGADGRYELRVENENRQAVKELTGNLYEDTGHQRPQEG